MPANKPYPGEDPAVARKRIAKNRASVRNKDKTTAYDSVKTKSDMMAENISSTIKNMGGGY
tara:strand:- start:507 stop:689 length:183 start_codon:yes stop_codon:yes gene_type:complete